MRRPSSAARVPALACTLPISLVRRNRSSALFELHRLARGATATAGSVSEAPAKALRMALQSTTDRSERVTESAMRALMRPGLARRLHQRQPHARRRAGAERGIGAGRDGDAHR